MSDIAIHFDSSAYQKTLLIWFEAHGRHDLPWQGDFHPYYVWLSEIMLQQTQVKTVTSYFLKFIDIFPTIKTLAQASQDQVMQHWAGLGYYARARNLHKAAKLICEQYTTSLPNSFEALIRLPGIGKSTAHAILSIAFNQSTPILDGNVKRVFSRIFAINTPMTESIVERELWQLADKLMPENNTQAYTQAQMDLGATVCTRTKPKCNICPLQYICLAYKSDSVESYPVKKPKKAKKIKSTLFYLYSFQNEIALLKKPNEGIWGGLYTLPEMSLAFGQYSHMLCEDQRHIFTHFELYYDIKVYHLDEKHALPKGMCWVSRAHLPQYGLPAPLKKHLL